MTINLSCDTDILMGWRVRVILMSQDSDKISLQEGDCKAHIHTYPQGSMPL